ncbi:MAG: nucleotidyl transferase AbiEii/AbiGii toxin family protein [Pyrinomonadaceae bacterium]
MTEKQFYDWQTLGGTDDVMRFVNALERADILWCAIGGVAVNHWAAEQMVTQDVDFVVAADSTDRARSALVDAGFAAEEFEWSINFNGKSKIALQLSTEAMYHDFTSRGVAANVHGILLRVASLEDTLSGKIRAWSDPKRRQSKRIKDLADIARLVESHPHLWQGLTSDLKQQIECPPERGRPRPQ